jgi:hypothetical protein
LAGIGEANGVENNSLARTFFSRSSRPAVNSSSDAGPSQRIVSVTRVPWTIGKRIGASAARTGRRVIIRIYFLQQVLEADNPVRPPAMICR